MNKDSILLHLCCAPCAAYVNDNISTDGFFVKGLFYNPNIFPHEEYSKRKDSVVTYAGIKSLDIEYLDNDVEHIPGDCKNCYEYRLAKSASYAKANNYGAFTTTLLVSPYQKHDLIKEIGISVGKNIGVDFFYRDFREGFYKGRQMARDAKLYSQRYCGCSASVR